MARTKKQTKRRRNDNDAEQAASRKRRRINPQSRRSHPPVTKVVETKEFDQERRAMRQLQSQKEQEIVRLRIMQREEMNQLRASFDRDIDALKEHIHVEIDHMEIGFDLLFCRICCEQRGKNNVKRCESCSIVVCSDCAHECESEWPLCQEWYCNGCAKDALTMMNCGLRLCSSECEYYHVKSCECPKSHW